MTFFSIFVLLTNMACLVYLTIKTRRIRKIELCNRQIQINIEELVRENSRIVDVIVDELEKKLSESKALIQYFEENTFIAPRNTEVLPFNAKMPKKITRHEASYGNEKAGLHNLAGLEEMSDNGLTYREIAENLKITQGEVALKLNMRKYLCKKQLL